MASATAQQVGPATPKLHRARKRGLLVWAASVTCTRSTHVYRTPTVSQARRQGDHGGGPQGSVSGLPQEPTRGEEGLPDVTAKQNGTSKSKAEPRYPWAIHHRGIWGGGGPVLPEASPEPREPRFPSNSTPKPRREAKLTGGRGGCHRGETLAPAAVQLLANPLTRDLIGELLPSDNRPRSPEVTEEQLPPSIVR